MAQRAPLSPIYNIDVPLQMSLNVFLQVFGWGYNGNGQLGLGNNVNMPNPSRVSGLQDTIITQVSRLYYGTLIKLFDERNEYYIW